MKQISHFLSFMFSPLLVPTYGMILAAYLTILSILPGAVLWTTISITFVLTCVVPLSGIYAMYRSGIVTDVGLNKRGERSLPYILTILCYLGCGYFMYRAAAPMWLVMFFAGGAAAIVINILVNLKWKISAHAASMGGLVAMMFRFTVSHAALYDMNVWISGAIIMAGLVMTARVYLGRHTLMQVLAGAANGYCCVWFMTMIQ